MSIKYLSSSGLTEVWSNIKAYIASKIPSKIITGLSIKGRTITYTNSDGTTGTLTTQDTDTTYASMSAAEATTGTATTARSISAKVLHDKITSITNTKANDSDVVHKGGTETIVGTKTFSNVIFSNKELAYKDTKYDWTNTSLDTWCDAGHTSWSDKTNSRRMHELVGTKGGVWQKVCFINEQPYFSVNSNRNITYWGTTIAFHGTTTFTGNVICNGTSYLKMTNLESNTTTPTSAQYKHISVVANDGSQVGNIQFCKRADGSFDITIYSNIGGSNDGTLRITSNNEVYPLNNKTKLGNSTAKWSEVWANTFNGNLVGNANTATKATQDAAGNVITTTYAKGADVVHKSGNETIAGLKTFSSWQIINMGLNVKWITGNKEQKALRLFGSMNDKYEGIGAILELRGDDGMFALIAQDKTSNNIARLLGFPGGALTWDGYIQSHGVHSTTGNAFMAQNGSYTFLIRNDGSNTYLLMSDKDGVPGTWSTARPLIISNATGVCSINGNANSATYATNANSATYATTQATTDNSTKIATTAWVRTYVNSVVGSGSVSTTVTAFWGSSSSTGDKWARVSGLNGTKRVTSTTNTFTPVVGQIYSGNQLYSTATANGSVGDTGAQSPSPEVVYARLDLSGAFNSSHKYLCTTAVGVNAKATVDVTGHTTSTSSGPYTTITSYTGFTKAVYGGKSTFLRVQ